MTTFERRQAILRLVQEQAGVKVSQLADTLGVSEGTIRNDLAALDEEGQLMRVRGGAVARAPVAAPSRLVARARVNADDKERIAQWAASMVEDGDTIVLDASTTVLHLASYLQTRSELTVITNGLEVARRLAESPTNTVLLIGGVLRPDGNTVSGTLGSEMLADLHIRTAFVSAVGFAPGIGLMESDIAQGQLKRAMIQNAQRVVALVDHSKFTQIGLTPFVRLHEIEHLITDGKAPAEALESLRAAGVSVTVVGDHATTTYSQEEFDSKHYRIGFANLSEDMPFGRDVRRGLERAAKASGQVELIVADNQLSGEIAIDVAESMIAANIDLMIEYQIDEGVGGLLMHRFSQAGIPVIAVDIPMVGATFFGVDNYQTGYLAGVELGRSVQAQWNGEFDYLIVLEHPRAGNLTAARIQGQIEGFRSIIGEIDPQRVITLDSGNTTQISETQMLQALQALPVAARLAVVSFNDDAAIGAVEAARKVHRLHDVLIVGQGADRRLRDELRRPGTRVVGSTAFQPELYGEHLIAIALKILNGERVSPAVFMAHTFVSPANVDILYPPGVKDR
jgi:ribose transport system substrate-binding protein